MKQKRLCLLFLVMCVLFTFFAGCETSDPVETSTATPTEDAASTTSPAENSDIPESEAPVNLYPLADELTTLTCMNYIYLPATGYLITGYEDMEIYELAEEITNVHIDFTTVNTEAYGELVNITIAGGDYPDIEQKWIQFSGSSASQMIEDEVLVDLAPYLEDYFPNLMSLLGDYPDALRDMMTDDGELASTYSISMQNNEVFTSGLVIRQDYLDTLNLEIPETYEQMEETLLALNTAYDMDTPFQLHSYGLSTGFTLGFNTYLSVTSPAGGIELRSFYQEDDQVKFGWLDEQLTDILTMLNRWYNEGLLNADYLVMSDIAGDDSAISARTNGKSAVFDSRLGEIDSYIATGQEFDSNYSLSPLSHLGITEDQEFLFSTNKKCSYSSEAYGITTACDELEIACRWLDFWYSETGIMFSNYGVEGTTYNFENGEVVFTDLILAPEGEATTRQMLSIWTNLAMPTLVDDERDVLVSSDQVAYFVEVWNANASTEDLLPSALSLTAEESEQISTIYSDIETYIIENVVKFIVGDLPLSDIAAFQDNIENNMGLSDAIDIMQTAYNRYLQRGA